MRPIPVAAEVTRLKSTKEKHRSNPLFDVTPLARTLWSRMRRSAAFAALQHAKIIKVHPVKSFIGAAILLFLLAVTSARGEAMLEFFQVNWSDLINKMPEIAEAGYTSLWLPPPAKGGSGYSVGYDLFDPFDLGDKNQRGTTATKYGTKAQLIQLVETAHRFGIRVYFDNIMNHRAFDVPGYNSSTPTNLYPGLIPQDFHLQTVSGGFYRNWPNVQNYGNQWDVQYESLSGLIDLANEPGTVNGNYGPRWAAPPRNPLSSVNQPTPITTWIPRSRTSAAVGGLSMAAMACRFPNMSRITKCARRCGPFTPRNAMASGSTR